MSKILLVDDDTQSLESTKKMLEFDGHQVETACDGEQGLLRAREIADLDLILTDVRMPKMGGFDFFRALMACGETIPVVFMTAFGQVDEAVWAMKSGAVDFLTKPFKRQALRKALESALKRAPSLKTRAESSPELQRKIIGISQEAEALRRVIVQVAPVDATVLILGESGSGKEQVARAIAEKSLRAGKPFIVLNCAAIPEHLIEAELFGYEKGAFSGAVLAKEGLFEAANGGILFLDEIGDMPLLLQAKLLRVLQDHEVRRLGSTQSTHVDVRVIAATHRDLNEMVKAREFREDLFFRLSVVEIRIPPLRSRIADIPELLSYFLAEFCKRHDKKIRGFSEGALEILLSHPYPGNIRELANIVERAVIFTDNELIEVTSLPDHLSQLPLLASGTDESREARQGPSQGLSFPIGTSLKEAEEELIKRTLEATGGDKNLAAKILGVNSRTIYRWLERTSSHESANAGGSESSKPPASLDAPIE